MFVNKKNNIYLCRLKYIKNKSAIKFNKKNSIRCTKTTTK